MRVTLIYPNIGNIPGYNIGLGIIARHLRKRGHEVQGLTVEAKSGADIDMERVASQVIRFNPGLVGFSSVTNQYPYVIKIAEHLRSKGVSAAMLLGGIHATIDSDTVLNEGHVDMICRGEGEEAVAELCEKLERGEDVSQVRNIWLKINGRIIKNPLRPLVEDLGTLPFPDTSLFSFERILSDRDGWLNILVGRGCPYKCSYCVNHYLKDEYKGSKFYRIRPIEHVLQEIQEVSVNYEIKVINFIDEIFTLNRKWVLAFCEEYAKRFKYPFAVCARATNWDIEVARALKKAGCIEAKIGIESGSKRVREHILRRKTPNETIKKAFAVTREAGIRAWSFNMIGIPTETREELLETAKLNAAIRPYIMRVSILYPYKGTAFYEYCRKHGLIDEDRVFKYNSYFDGSVLNLENMSEGDVSKYKIMFKWYVDSFSSIESAGLFRELLSFFEDLPEEMWLDGRAKRLFEETDKGIDGLLKVLKKEHYSSRNHIDLNFSASNNWELP